MPRNLQMRNHNRDTRFEARRYRSDIFIALSILLLTGLYLRWNGLDWDHHHHYHPDERYISWVGTTIEFGTEGGILAALNPAKSTFNPFYWPDGRTTVGVNVPKGEQRDFAYGHLPLYAGVLTTRFVESIAPPLQPLLTRLRLGDTPFNQTFLNQAARSEFDHVTIVGRWLTGLVDVGTLIFLFLLGKQLHSRFVGLLAAGFLAVNVMHIQLSHFFTTDTYMTFFVVVAIYFMSRAIGDRGQLFETAKPVLNLPLILAAIAIGLAVGSKFSAIMIGLPFLVTAILYDRYKIIQRLLLLGLIVLTTLFITNPFMLLDNSCELESTLFGQTYLFYSPGSCYISNISAQNSMVRGSERFPFTAQYAFTIPYIYYIEDQIRWGMGYALGVAAFLGMIGWLAVYGYQSISALFARKWTRQAILPLIIILWVVPFFLTTGSFYVKFMRYMQPMTPFLMIFAAWVLVQIRPAWLRNSAIGLVFGFTALYALAYSNIYHQEHPWQTASIWLFENADDGATVANEIWDEPLPSRIHDRLLTEPPIAISESSVNWLSGQYRRDSKEKLQNNLSTLAEADYIVIASNRGYGVTPRLWSRYPYSSQYYPLLFSEALGYKLVFVDDRAPELFGVSFSPDTFSRPRLSVPAEVSKYYDSENRWVLARADESFTVYDQPLTLIFQNVERLSAEEMEAKFEDLE